MHLFNSIRRIKFSDYYFFIGILTLLLALHNNLYPILDGRVAPIYLDTRYTFSNFEWARGNVYFKQGFDLPVNGTAFIDITQEVGNDIAFQHSTMILTNDLILGNDATITGSGFISPQGNTIFFKSTWVFQSGRRFIFTSDGVLEGTGSTAVDLAAGGFITFTPSVSTFTFRRLDLRFPTNSNFFTASNAPSTFVMESARLMIGGGTFTINATQLSSVRLFEIRGFEGSGFKCTNRLAMRGYGDLIVYPGLSLSVNDISSTDSSGGLILDNARLIYTSTATSVSLFSNSHSPSFAARGILTVRGQSLISSPTAKQIQCLSGSTINIETGSRLIIQPNIKLAVF